MGGEGELFATARLGRTDCVGGVTGLAGRAGEKREESKEECGDQGGKRTSWAWRSCVGAK